VLRRLGIRLTLCGSVIVNVAEDVARNQGPSYCFSSLPIADIEAIAFGFVGLDRPVRTESPPPKPCRGSVAPSGMGNGRPGMDTILL